MGGRKFPEYRFRYTKIYEKDVEVPEIGGPRTYYTKIALGIVEFNGMDFLVKTFNPTIPPMPGTSRDSEPQVYVSYFHSNLINETGHVFVPFRYNETKYGPFAVFFGKIAKFSGSFSKESIVIDNSIDVLTAKLQEMFNISDGACLNSHLKDRSSGG